MAKRFRKVAVKYAEDVIAGRVIIGKEVVAACRRFLDDLGRDDLELRDHEPDLAINIMQTTLVHAQGEDLDGKPLLGRPFILEPWEIFIVYNLLGFYYKGTDKRRFNEAFIEVARKNGKT
jgi:phage terminase large subunit-like protein